MKDLIGKEVKKGDKVAVLIRTYKYWGVCNVSLDICTFVGKGRYGYEFKDHHKRIHRQKIPYFLKVSRNAKPKFLFGEFPIESER